MKAAAIVVFFLVIPAVCFAATIYVPDDHGTIQAAINAAADGDTVVVRAGTYLENIDFVGKAITVKSESGPRRTVIDGTRSGSVVTFQSGEGPGSVLEGFSVTNGLGAVNPYRTGGGVHCESASPTLSGNFISGNEAGDDGAGILCDGNCFPVISGNTLTANRASRYGGAIYCYLSSPDIVDNVIMANRAISRGGGIYCSDSSPMISGNLFHGNTTDGRGGALYFKYCDDEPLIVSNLISWNGAAGSGGGIYCQNEPSLRLVGNTLTENYSGTGGGIYCLDSSAILTNTIVWNNTATQDPEIYATSASALVVTYCDVRGGWTGTGNIDADPLFVDPAASDYHIPFDSPCRSAGDRNAQGLPEHDFEGDPRTGLFAFPDIGADEFHTHFYVTGRLSNGDSATGVIIGWPKTNPVMLISGSGVLPSPDPTPYGDFWLMPPWNNRVHFDAMPDNGVKVIDRVVSTGLLPGTTIPVQALVGTELSNLWIITIE